MSVVTRKVFVVASRHHLYTPSERDFIGYSNYRVIGASIKINAVHAKDVLLHLPPSHVEPVHKADRILRNCLFPF